MNETNEMWREWRENVVKPAKRRRHARSLAAAQALNLRVKLFSEDHWRVTPPDPSHRTFDYWPTTGTAKIGDAYHRRVELRAAVKLARSS